MRDPSSSEDSFVCVRTLTGHTRDKGISALTFTSEDELISGRENIRVWSKTSEGLWKESQVLTKHKENINVIKQNPISKEEIVSGADGGELIVFKKKEGNYV